MEQRLHFDTVASLYDRVRPGYASLLIDDLVRLSGIGAGASVLDIGCGTGKSTEPFVKRGFKVCGLDPGVNMPAICKAKLKDYADVRYETAEFETWNPEGSLFNLVVSGTAFHWITEKAHNQLIRVLKPDGAMGIFWHTYLNGKEPIFERLNEIYRNYAPELFVEDLEVTQELEDLRKEQLLRTISGFTQWRVIRYYEKVRYDSRTYVDLLRTWSTHISLNGSFFDAVGEAIETAGGVILKPIRTTLCFGKREKE